MVRESEGVGGKLAGECGEVCVRKKEAEGEKSVRHGTTGEGEGVKKVGSEQEGGAGKVRVGSVWVSVGGALKKGEVGEDEVEKVVGAQGKVGRNASTEKMKMCTKLVRKYKSCEEDMNWASRGLVGTVINGESIPLIQKRVEDANFTNIDIIPLGADKVFIHSLSGDNFSVMVRKAK